MGIFYSPKCLMVIGWSIGKGIFFFVYFIRLKVSYQLFVNLSTLMDYRKAIIKDGHWETYGKHSNLDQYIAQHTEG